MFNNIKLIYRFSNYLYFIIIVSIIGKQKMVYTLNIANVYSNMNNVLMYSTFQYLIVTLTIYLTITMTILARFILKKNKLMVNTLPILLVISLYVLTKTNNIYSFFYMYEVLLIPSVLIVYWTSPNKRSVVISSYFLFWTQLGSFLVLIALFLLYKNSGVVYFFKTKYAVMYGIDYIYIIKVFILLGFGIKIPIWPFHFWLTKTHVESSTGFSIFLSGVLVKTALFGIIKLSPIINQEISLVLIMLLFGAIDVCFKIEYQIDFKKMVAYLTIQEMGLLTVFILFNSTINQHIFYLFTILHTICSGVFFLLTDLIYKRYGTRQFNYLNNLINNLPQLNSYLIVFTLIFIGLPYTVKFTIEIIMLSKFISVGYLITGLFLVFIQYITIFFFFKKIMNIVFGDSTLTKPDLNITETSLLFIFFIPLIFLNTN